MVGPNTLYALSVLDSMKGFVDIRGLFKHIIGNNKEEPEHPDVVNLYYRLGRYGHISVSKLVAPSRKLEESVMGIVSVFDRCGDLLYHWTFDTADKDYFVTIKTHRSIVDTITGELHYGIGPYNDLLLDYDLGVGGRNWHRTPEVSMNFVKIVDANLDDFEKGVSARLRQATPQDYQSFLRIYGSPSTLELIGTSNKSFISPRKQRYSVF